MALTNAERRQKAALLKDSRPLPDKVAAAQRKPIPLAPASTIDAEISRLEKQRYEAKLAKMDPESRRLTVLKEIRDREPVEPGKPHPRITKIEGLIDSIVSNPDRELADYELAVLVLAQHQPGMSPEAADQLWRELVDQESGYLNQKRQAAIDKQTALIQELQSIDVGLAGIVDTPAAPPNGYAVLRAIPQYGHQYGVTVSPQEFAEIEAASGNAEAEQAVAQRFAARINQYVAAVGAEQNAGEA